MPPERSGIAFRGSKLYDFQEDRVLVIRGGNEPAAWVKSASRHGRGGTWLSSKKMADELMRTLVSSYPAGTDSPTRVLPNGAIETTGGQLLFPFMERFVWRTLVQNRFVSTIPPDILERLRQVVNGQWYLYSLLARCGPASFDLFDANPPLAWALAYGQDLTGVHRPLRSARALLGKSQKEILAWLEFPPTESVRKIIAKINLQKFHLEGLRSMREMLCKDLPGNGRRRMLLRHVKRIDSTTVGCMMTAPELLSVRLLDEAASAGSELDVLPILKDTVRMAADLGSALRAPFESLSQLQSRHNGLATGYRCIGSRPPFPPPPFIPPPETGITPITDGFQLCREAREQLNCCASYTNLILQGDYFIYRVEQPVRATLGIRCTDRRWRPDQVQLKGNHQVPAPIADALFSAILGNATPQSFEP